MEGREEEWVRQKRTLYVCVGCGYERVKERRKKGRGKEENGRFRAGNQSFTSVTDNEQIKSQCYIVFRFLTSSHSSFFSFCHQLSVSVSPSHFLLSLLFMRPSKEKQLFRFWMCIFARRRAWKHREKKMGHRKINKGECSVSIAHLGYRDPSDA